MREILYRVYDKKTNQIFDCTAIYPNGKCRVKDGSSDRVVYDGVLMQWIGLLDKNGVKIFEGDIVQIGGELIEEVEWVDEGNWIADKCPVNGWVNYQSIYKEPVEVIGNIYQTPNLLTKDDE